MKSLPADEVAPQKALIICSSLVKVPCVQPNTSFTLRVYIQDVCRRPGGCTRGDNAGNNAAIELK